MITRHEFHPQGATQIEVGGPLLQLGLFLKATAFPSLGIGLNTFRENGSSRTIRSPIRTIFIRPSLPLDAIDMQIEQGRD
jgi:hypothetical protein